MAKVKCFYCGKTFDREKEPYVKPQGRRYAHAACYLKKKEEDPKTPDLEIFDPTSVFICHVCGQPIYSKKERYQKIFYKHYVHDPKCYKEWLAKEKDDAELLDIYLMNLFQWDYVLPKIKKQINQYIETYHFTYSGIQKSLEYYYNVKGNVIQEGQSHIGIVPYIYQDAYKYYYNAWLASQKNRNVHARDFVPRIKEVRIPPPQSPAKKRKLFTFLDEEEEINEQ